jgi:23S rRNA (cytidine1920-2'-O)/16S rRNA (cytidine1409-2'-O)-methyltransferase
VAARRRLDAELVRRGLVPSRQQAQEAIEAGRVLVGGAPAAKAARLVGPGEPLTLQGPGPAYVSRGGRKLEAALDGFALSPAGLRCLDAGASTGGFTDCLLQRGAAHVVAVDVGHNLLHERLRGDPRVTLIERTNVRALDLGERFPLVVADLSFISLRTVAPALVAHASADLVLLVKPQFEAGRAEASKGRGVISDPAVHERVVEEVVVAFASLGAVKMGTMRSPVTGADGNVELLLHLSAAGRSDDPGIR